jgi:cell division protein FtsL
VQKRAQATPARVQQLATRQLQMRPVTPGITQYVSVSPVSSVAPSTEPAAAPAPEGAR